MLATKYRLGLPVFDSAGPCPACLRQSDVHGDHAMCCGSGGERISRHNNLKDAIYQTAVAAGLGPVHNVLFVDYDSQVSKIAPVSATGLCNESYYVAL